MYKVQARATAHPLLLLGHYGAAWGANGTATWVVVVKQSNPKKRS